MSRFRVRALYRSVRIAGLIAPNDTAHLKIFYPAAPSQSVEELETGRVAVATDGGPFPVVIMLPGINVGPEGLLWLAQGLSAHGIIVVTYTLIGEEFAGSVSLTPGLDIQALTPDTLGTRPSGLTIDPILNELHACNHTGILQRRIDLTRVILGGHSAGGTVALLNANPDWFDGIVGCFSYAAHTAAATMLGYQKGTLNPIDPRVAILLLGGSADGVIAQSAARYGDMPGDATGRLVATFDQAISRDQGDCTLAILDGANHFSICFPKDLTTGRPFLDQPETASDARGLIGALVEAFVLERFGLFVIDTVREIIEQRHQELLFVRHR